MIFVVQGGQVYLNKARHNKKNSRTRKALLLSSVGITGFEPVTPNSRSWCANRTALHPDDNYYRKKSGYQDSNLGPPAPKAGALTGLRYIPKTKPSRIRGAKIHSFFFFAKFLFTFLAEGQAYYFAGVITTSATIGA